MRLLTYLQKKHWISRRTIVSYINDKKVFLNKKIVEWYKQEMSEWDVLFVRWVIKMEVVHIAWFEKSKLVAFNKPVGYVVSRHDPYNASIFKLLPDELAWYYYLGRLDKNSHGLLLMTNDPALVHKRSHPSFLVEKEYIVRIDKEVSLQDIKKLEKWIEYEWDLFTCKSVEKITEKVLKVILFAGKKRHIRRMLEWLDYKVFDLQRVREWEYLLGDLPLGKFIFLENNV